MRGSMLTEDIDSSMRTVERGLKIRSDRDVVSRELATTTFEQVWNQRLRWAQGWFQVTMMHAVRVWRSPGLTLRQKFGASYLLGYREVYPWLSLQIFPLVAYWLSRGDTLSYGWPIFLCTTLFVLHIGPIQTWYAYRLADWEIKQHKSWFWAYLLFATLFYTEYKNTIARVAHIKEFVGERAWKVTPRGDAPIEFDDDDVDELDELDEASNAGAEDSPNPVVAAAASGLPTRGRRAVTNDDVQPDVVESRPDVVVEIQRDLHPDAVVDGVPERVEVAAIPAERTVVGSEEDSPLLLPSGLPSRRPGVEDDPPLPSRREPAEVRADGLPQRTRVDAAARRAPSSSDGRVDLLGGRALPARTSARATGGDARSGDAGGDPGGDVAGGEVESGRLARRTSGLHPTVGLAGEPLLGRASAPTLRPARLDETLISARIRELVERRSAPRPPAGESLPGGANPGPEHAAS